MHHAWTKNGGKDLSRGIAEMAKIQESLLHLTSHLNFISIFKNLNGVNNIDFLKKKKPLLHKVSNTLYFNKYKFKRPEGAFFSIPIW